MMRIIVELMDAKVMCPSLNLNPCVSLDPSNVMWNPIMINQVLRGFSDCGARKAKGHIYWQFESQLACTEMKNAKGIWAQC